MRRRIETTYVAGWFTVGIPIILTFLIWCGIPLLVISRMGWDAPEGLVVALCGGSLALALAVNVAIYPFLTRWARRGQGELILEGDRLRWRKGRSRGEVDFNRPYWARIDAGGSGLGEANASITLRPGEEIIQLRGATRREVLQAFPEPYFVGEMAVSAEEGLWGFSLRADASSEREFFFDLIRVLWQTREQNSLYHLFRRFPWDTPPRPAFSHIEVVEAKTCTEEMRTFIARLESQKVSAPVPWLVATPNYLLGYRMTLLGKTVRYFIMPLGHVYADDTPLPRPEWGPFVLGHVVQAAVDGAGTAMPLEHKQYINIIGRDRNGQPLTVSLEWVEPGDETYEEAKFFVRFVNRRGPR